MNNSSSIPSFGLSATWIVGVALTLVVLVLAVQNTEAADLKFLSWDASIPLVVVILGAALAGVILDEVSGLFWRRHRRRQLSDRLELQRLKRSHQPAESNLNLDHLPPVPSLDSEQPRPEGTP